MVFLGVQFDTLTMAMSITPERIEELHHRCASSLSLSRNTRHDLQSLLGVMSFVTACVRPARVFMSTLLNTLRLHKHSSFCVLSDENKAELCWWCHFLPLYNGVSLVKMSPWINDPWHISTDACSTGAGGYFNENFFHTPFPDPTLQLFGYNINFLELLTIMAALKLWGQALRGQRFVLHCDNNNSVLALNSGRSGTICMQLCLREIWFLSAFYDFEITTVHIPRLDNSLADHLSRWHLSPVHKVQFHQLTSHTSTTQVVCPARVFDFPADINQPPVPRFTQPLTPANLAVLVSQVQAHAYDPGTLRNLHSQWKSFLHFCSTYHVTPLPAASPLQWFALWTPSTLSMSL